MHPKLLITGSAGYIGGSLLHKLLNENGSFSKSQVVAAVRSSAQVQALKQSGIEAITLDLADTAAVAKAIDDEEVNIVIHIASSVDPSLATNLISALGERSKRVGDKAYFIHTSGSSAFSENTGWPTEARDDTETIFQVEKQHADSFPLRKTDVVVTEYAEQQGVTSFIVVPSIVYGEGSGQWNRVSVVLPALVKAFAAKGAVYKFPQDTTAQAVHISDMVSMYELILQRIVQEKSIESGPRGYYCAFANQINWWQIIDSIHHALLARNALKEQEVLVWPSSEYAAGVLDVAEGFVVPLWNSGAKIVTTAGNKLGWAPQWTKEDFLRNIDSEVESIFANTEVKSSLMQMLKGGGKA